MTGARIAVAVAVVAALAALFFVVRPEDDGSATPGDATATAATPTAATTTAPAPPRPERVRVRINVRGGRPLGGLVLIDARRGERITLRVTADSSDHVHVHGYDLFADVAPGKPAVLDFNARLTGRFEVELEDTHQQIAQLRVTE